jgi:hypothetical protein
MGLARAWRVSVSQTISTVGYGDFSPKSFIGKVAIMIIIVVAIALVPFVINILITAWHDYNGTRRVSVISVRTLCARAPVVVVLL